MTWHQASIAWWLATGSLAFTLTGCGDLVEESIDPQRLVVAEAVDGELALRVSGWIDNRAPVAYGPKLSWMPFADVVSDGARIATGEVLVHHDITMLLQWITGQKAELRQIEADTTRQRLERERQLDELLVQATDVRADDGIHAAKRDADRLDEESGRRLAGMQATEANTILARTERTLTAVEELAQRGRVPALDVVRARTARDQARFQAAAAERASREWDDGVKAIARQRLELACERTRRELDASSGIDGRIGILRRLIEQELAMIGEDQRRVSTDLAQRQAFADDPVLRSHTSGTVRLRDANVKTGAKLPSTPCLFVLEDHEMIAYVSIPEPMRDLASVWTPSAPDLGRAELNVRALDGLKISGRVISIAATPEKQPSGGRAFLAVVSIDDAVGTLRERLKPGMGVDCDLLRPVHAAALPTWAVHVTTDPREPQIRLPDGSQRVVRGLVSGSRFVVTEGLAAGDQVVALANNDADTNHTRLRRLTGLIEPAEVVPVRLKTGFWDVVEVVPDGARVQAGQLVARLAKSAWWIDPERMRWQREANRLRAEAERAAERLRADQAIAEATKAWRDADLDLRDARLAWQAAGMDDAAKRFEEAEIAHAAATATADQAHAAATAAKDPRVAVSLSHNGIADLVLADERAQAGAAHAALNAAAARSPDLLSRLAAASTFVEAMAKADDARSAWFVARTTHAQKLDHAESAYARKSVERERDARELEDESVYATASGRILHRNWAPFRPGDSIWTNEPFRILPDSADGSPVPRKLTVEAPAHLAGTWRTDDVVQVIVPGVGRFTATVQVVGTWYGTSTAGREEADAGGSSTAVDEQVFNLTVRFLVPGEQAERVLPGMTAYVE